LKRGSEILKNIIFLLLIVFLFVSCKKTDISEKTEKAGVIMDYEINALEDGFSSVKFDKDYAFDKFINNGGVKNRFL